MPRDRKPVKRREEGEPPVERKRPPSRRDPMEDLQEHYRENERDLETEESSKQ